MVDDLVQRLTYYWMISNHNFFVVVKSSLLLYHLQTHPLFKMHSYFIHLPGYFLLLLMAYSQSAVVDSIAVGDNVCMIGYIMDIFCIELGVLLDNPQITTLEEPENHSFHCLFDESVCYESGFVMLGEKDLETSLHCLGPRLEETEVVIAAGRAAGSSEKSDTHIICRTCTGDASKPVSGFRATVRGTVKDLGDGSSGVSGQPVLTNIELLDFEAGCGEEDGIVVRNIGGECQILPSGTSPPSSATPSLVSSIAPSEGTTQQQQVHPTTMPSDEFTLSSTPSSTKVPSESLGPSSSSSESITANVSTRPSFFSSSLSNSISPSLSTHSSAVFTSGASSPDCTTQFCEKSLSDEYFLRYMVNVEEDTITMEAIYEGVAWVAIAFSEDEKMPSSDAVM